MPEEEKELTELPKKKEKEQILKGIELKHMVALAVLGVVTFWIYSNSQEFQTMVNKNMFWVLLIIMGIVYWFTSRGKIEMPIGMIQGETLCGQWVEYKQKKGDMPDGKFTIKESKRKHVDENPKDYYFDVRIDTDKKPDSFLVSVDSKTGDITTSEPAIITRLSEEPSAQDVFIKKKRLKKEEEWEEI